MRRLVFALMLAGVASSPPPFAASTDSLTDRCAVTLGSNWTGADGAVTDWVVSDGAGGCVGTTPGADAVYVGADYALAYYNAASFTDDQYSQAVISKGVNGYNGVAVRLSGTTGSQNGYSVSLESGCTIYKWVSGTRSSIGTCTDTWVDGHTLKLSVTGTALTVTDNGSSVGSATDSSVTSGKPGIMGYSQAGTARISNWQGDNVGGGGPTFPAAIVNALIRCCR
jgi:hypothetical protein